MIKRIPDHDILRLRKDLLDKLRTWPPIPPIPDPGPRINPAIINTGPVIDPGPLTEFLPTHLDELPAPERLQTRMPISSTMQSMIVSALASSSSVEHIRRHLVDLPDLIAIHLCDLLYLWQWFQSDCLATVDADDEGRFGTFIPHHQHDQPDLYLWVEQFQEGMWTTVYRPSIGCGTHWNYTCGTPIEINLPRAVACEEPPFDIPRGVTLFVLPWAIGSSPIWGIPEESPPAPQGWLRPDGMINYVDESLGLLDDAPFGGTLNFIHDDSYFIPDDDIMYYRYSWRRHSEVANTGDDDSSWMPISTPLYRAYRMEYSDRLPTYESFPAGPVTVGPNSGLFKFKPQTPPPRPPTDPGTVIAREWHSGNRSETAARWNTLLAAPPLSPENTLNSAGDFDIKIEVFNKDGLQVQPGEGSFSFLALKNIDRTSTRTTTPAETAGGAYVMRVNVDNNSAVGVLPQPSIDGVAALNNCGFLRYQPGDHVHVQFKATQPDQHAVFNFDITRGSNRLASASTTRPYVEVDALNAPASTGMVSYRRSGDDFAYDFTPTELTGTCINAAFAASLGVHVKAWNGSHRLSHLDSHKVIAFALTEKQTSPH